MYRPLLRIMRNAVDALVEADNQQWSLRIAPSVAPTTSIISNVLD